MTKDNEKINIEITRAQLKEMILAAMFYSWIRGGLADVKGEDFKEYEKLEEYFLKIAKENNLDDLSEEFHGHLVPTDELSKLEEVIMEEYDDDVFWHELATRLGKRDFWRTITPEEKKKIRKDDWLPERIQEIYDKYQKEFEENGIEGLVIAEKDYNNKI